MPLADVYRHFCARGRTPEDAKSEILELIWCGLLPHQVDSIVEFLPREDGYTNSRTGPPPRQVRKRRPMPPEVLELNSTTGRGSLDIYWMDNNAVRRRV